MTARAALVRELKRLGPAVATSALAASALQVARRLDDPKTSAAAAAALARELRESLTLLRAAAEPEREDRMSKYERPKLEEALAAKAKAGTKRR